MGTNCSCESKAEVTPKPSSLTSSSDRGSSSNGSNAYVEWLEQRNRNDLWSTNRSTASQARCSADRVLVQDRTPEDAVALSAPAALDRSARFWTEVPDAWEYSLASYDGTVPQSSQCDGDVERTWPAGKDTQLVWKDTKGRGPQEFVREDYEKWAGATVAHGLCGHAFRVEEIFQWIKTHDNICPKCRNKWELTHLEPVI